VRQIMYGFGDDESPAPDSVELMEDMLNIYLQDLCDSVSKLCGGSKPKTSDFLHALRKDPKKLARAYELLLTDQDLKAAR
ncbi:transcription initiation factor IID, 18kDa subunit, partial [Blyttiomyces helicus]